MNNIPSIYVLIPSSKSNVMRLIFEHHLITQLQQNELLTFSFKLEELCCFLFFFLSLPRPKMIRLLEGITFTHTQTEDSFFLPFFFFLPLCSPQPIISQGGKRNQGSLNIYTLVTLFDTEKSYFYFCGSLSSLSLLFLPNLTHYCLYSIISIKEKKGKKNRLWQTEALNINLAPVPWPSQASVSQNPFHIRLNTTGSQLSSHKPLA